MRVATACTVRASSDAGTVSSKIRRASGVKSKPRCCGSVSSATASVRCISPPRNTSARWAVSAGHGTAACTSRITGTLTGPPPPDARPGSSSRSDGCLGDHGVQHAGGSRGREVLGGGPPSTMPQSRTRPDSSKALQVLGGTSTAARACRKTRSTLSSWAKWMMARSERSLRLNTAVQSSSTVSVVPGANDQAGHPQAVARSSAPTVPDSFQADHAHHDAPRD